MNYREKIRKAIECPQFGGNYGEWGALRLEQRLLIKRLLDELDSADECFKKFYEENEQLKARLELFENGVYFSRENDRLKEENEKLKKQLENKYSKTGTLTNEVLYEENTKLINQQQEFIKYLEDEIEKLKNEIFVNSLTGDDLDLYIMRVKLFKLNEILQKYKEIIGNDINVGSKGENKNENI